MNKFYIKLIILFLCPQFLIAGHITKFTNTSTVFKSGELFQVYFIDKTEDFFGQPLEHMRYAWDFGDNQTSQEMNPLHRYSKLGTYDIRLTVVDTSINFTSEYYKRINIQRFKDSCTTIIYDTMNITVIDTAWVTITDTTRIIVIDTVYVVSSSKYSLQEHSGESFYDVQGRFVTDDFETLPCGVFIVVGNNRRKKLIKIK